MFILDGASAVPLFFKQYSRRILRGNMVYHETYVQELPSAASLVTSLTFYIAI